MELAAEIIGSILIFIFKIVVIMLIWNTIMPVICEFQAIGFLQTLGLYILTSLLTKQSKS